MDALCKKRVLITGGAGFIGSHIARRLLRKGAKVSLLLKHDTDTWRIDDFLHEFNIIRVANVFDDTFISSKIGNIDYLIDLAFAGVIQGGNESDFNSVYFQNLENINTLLKLSARKKVRKFIYTGSCSEYPAGAGITESAVPRAMNAYSAAKTSGWCLAQAYCHIHGLHLTGLRPFTVYGPFEGGHRLIPTLMSCMLREENVDLTEGFQTRDFIFIEDIVDAYLQIMTNDHIPTGEVYNICTGKETSVRGVVDQLSRLSGVKLKTNFGKIPYRVNELMRLTGNFEKLRREINWTPKVGLGEGLQLSLDWFRLNLSKYQRYYRIPSRENIGHK